MRVLMIIPAYNEEESIFETVTSILNYRKKVDFDLDYVVINDGSTDKTKQILEENHFNAVNLVMNLGIGGAVQVVAAVLNPGDAESHPGQPGAIAAQFDKLEGGLDMVGKNELGVFIWLQLNDALGLIDDVAITGFFSYHIGAGREHRQVDFSALVSPELLGAIGPLHRFDLEYSVGDYLGGIVGIHLDEL